MKKPLWLVPVLLLAGCRSEQVAFQFQPAPATSVAAGLAPPAGAGPAAAPKAAAVATSEATVNPVPPPARRLHPRRLAAVLKALPPAVLASLATPPLANRPLAQRLGRRHTTEGAAENGLGRIALFFIGVVLAVLAGLGALVNVIFSVGFFTGVGYAAAGLVVLGLLYLLLSGGKKKTA